MDLQPNINIAAELDHDSTNYTSAKVAKKPNYKRARDHQAAPEHFAASTSLIRPSTCSKQQKVAARSSRSTSHTSTAAPSTGGGRNTSKYRGVTRHRWTGRYEAHLWDKNSWNQSRSKKGRQVYLGAYDDEDTAAHAYDLAALKYWGADTILNFPCEMYDKELEDMQNHTREEYIASLRRKSNGFSRGVSKYRGVARHHHNGRWEARIGRVYGNKYLYLGTYSTQEEAAIAYDIAAIQYRGLNAVTNFDMSNYLRWMKPGGHLLQTAPSSIDQKQIMGDGNNSAISSGQLDIESASPLKAPNMAAAVTVLDSATTAAYAHSKHHQQRLMQVCTETIICSNNAQSADKIDHPHMRLRMMQLENILGTSDVYDCSHILQDQASATCSAPGPPSFHGSSNNLVETTARAQHLLYLPSTYAKPTGHDASQLNTAFHLDKLMAEYKELLQSSSPKEMLEKGTFSAIMDTLADTASSSTSSSISTAPVHGLDNEQLNHIIKPGGYVEGLISPREEFFKYMEPMFDMSDMVLGKTDSICSSNDLSSIQELVACSISDPSCNNGMYPIHFNCVSPTNHGLMLDSSLNNTLASLLPTLNTFHQQYLQR